MDLAPGPTTGPLLQEFIHTEIDHEPQHWLDAGGALGRTTGAPLRSLGDLRRAHMGRLVAAYGPHMLDWMPDPM